MKMKSAPNALRKRLAGLFSVIFGLLSITAAQAQYLLTIDDSNPAATVITATGNFPGSATNSGPVSVAFGDGVDLLGFFTTSTTLNDPFPEISSTLTSGDGSKGPILDVGVGDNISQQNVDLTLYSSSSSAQMSFTAGQAAFSGTIILNLSSVGVPAVGAKGTIVTGYSGDASNTPIGQWEVVPAPEPSTYALVIGSLALLVFLRRNLRKA